MQSFRHSVVVVLSAALVAAVMSSNALFVVEATDANPAHRFIGIAPDATVIEGLAPTF